MPIRRANFDFNNPPPGSGVAAPAAPPPAAAAPEAAPAAPIAAAAGGHYAHGKVAVLGNGGGVLGWATNKVAMADLPPFSERLDTEDKLIYAMLLAGGDGMTVQEGAYNKHFNSPNLRTRISEILRSTPWQGSMFCKWEGKIKRWYIAASFAEMYVERLRRAAAELGL